MPDKPAPTKSKQYDLGSMADLNPLILAEDFAAPLVVRLADEKEYSGGAAAVTIERRRISGQTDRDTGDFCWADYAEPAKCCRRTYQGHIITEKAAIGLACLLLPLDYGLDISEVTRRGERADYWLGKRDALVEISGTLRADLNQLHEQKRQQLLDNPFGRGGYVMVVNFGRRECIVSHHKHAAGRDK